jgi:hypothetical protein
MRNHDHHPVMVESASAFRKRQNQQKQQDESTNMASFVAELNEDAKPETPKRERRQEATKSATIARGTDGQGCRSSRGTESSARTCGLYYILY